MAFSTQKDFLKIAFLNNRLEPVCSRKPGVKLKSYLSSTDSRAWAMSKEKQAHFLADLIACRNYVDGDYDEDGSGGDASGGAASVAKNKITNKDECEATCVHAEHDVPDDLPGGEPAKSTKSSRSQMTKESSTNVKYLQNQVDELRQENANLKAHLSDMQKNCTCSGARGGKGDMKAVIEERDKLKDQLSKMIGMEDKIAMLRKRAAQADCLEKELKSCRLKLCDLQRGSQCAMDALNSLAQKKDSLQSEARLLEQCQAERDCLKSKLDNLECQLHGMCSLQEQNEELCEQLRCAQCKLQKAQCLEQELINTRKRLCRSEQALEDYECQLHELMDVIEELESQKSFCCCTGGGGVGGETSGGDAIKDGHIQDLVTASKLTLDLVNVEFAARVKLQEQLKESTFKIISLKEEMSKESARIQQTSNTKIADLVKQLKDCKAENDKLKAKNDELCKSTKDAEKKISEARESIRKTIESVGRSAPPPLTPVREAPPEPASAPEPVSAPAPEPAATSTPEPVSTPAPEPVSSPTPAPPPPAQALASPSAADKCCDEAKQLREDLNKEKALWENKLKDMTALYEKAKDDVAKAKEEVAKAKEDCEKSKKSGDTAVEAADKIKKEKEDAQKEIKALNDVLNEQKDMLAAAKGELEKHRNDLTTCNERVATLEKEIGNLRSGNAELSKQLKDKENELAALNSKVNDLESQLAACQQKLKASTDAEASLKNQLDNLNTAMNDCKAEMNRIKDSKGGVDTAIAAKDNEIKAAIGNLDKCKADLEALRKQLQDKINGLQAEKDALEKEVAANKAQLGQLGKLVSEIEAERAKNKKLEGMVNDFEDKLKAVPKDVPKVGGGQDGQLAQAMDQLKKQLANETAKVNDLSAQLAKCQQALAEKNTAAAGAPPPSAAAPPSSVVAPPPTAPLPATAAPPPAARPPGVTQAIRAADIDKASSLAKIQNIHDHEKKDLSKNYDREIDALKVANQALRESLTKLKQAGGAPSGAGLDMSKILDTLEQLKKGASKCGQKKKCLTKLERICQKIIDVGIECLDIKELTYLHSEVYKAGLRLKPELLASENKNRCCKCTGFTCCLPSVPKDMEMKLINRILSLEREVESANELLLRFKECSAKKNTSCKSGRSEKISAYRNKDEINELLKLNSKEDKACGSPVRELYRKTKRNCKPRRDESGRRCD